MVTAYAAVHEVDTDDEFDDDFDGGDAAHVHTGSWLSGMITMTAYYNNVFNNTIVRAFCEK